MVTRTSMMEDYTNRDAALTDINLWEFVSRVEKYKFPAPSRRHAHGDEDPDSITEEIHQEDSDLPEVDANSMDVDPTHQNQHYNSDSSILADCSLQRPTYTLKETHPQHTTHALRILHPTNRKVPVPAGPSIPRRDKDSDREPHGRLMLIFFKPWMCKNDLKHPTESWLEAFQSWANTAPAEHLQRVKNMQILHECRDSRDDHNAQRRARQRDANRTLATAFPTYERPTSDIDDTFSIDSLVEADTLKILEDMDSRRSNYLTTALLDVHDTIQVLSNAELFDLPSISDIIQDYQINFKTNLTTPNSSLAESAATDADRTADQYTSELYKRRRQDWKDKAATAEERAICAQENHVERHPAITTTINHLSAAPTAQLSARVVAPAGSETLSQFWNRELTRFAGGVLWRYPLNTEQKLAFDNVLLQLRKTVLDVAAPPLRMVLSGAAGTGKSTVISAIIAMFTLINKLYNIRVCAYTGVAANNIEGMTLHTALCLINLSKTMRQRGPDATQFIDLLHRVRIGATTFEDYQTLSNRVLTNIEPTKRPNGLTTPILVGNNKTKDEINVAATDAFARRTGRQLHWYYSVDKIKQTVIGEGALKDKLNEMSGSHTHYKLGRIPVVIGMPVMLVQNFDVTAGVVNGVIGTLQSVKYTTNNCNHRIMQSCIVYCEAMRGESIEAIVPAFAMTVHKAQSRTLDKVLVDLKNTRSTAEPYVMLSRVRTLDQLFILRPFDWANLPHYRECFFRSCTSHYLLQSTTPAKDKTNGNT
ncbi:hypothetical protein DFP72DRAFT_849477 [Ephemerocybe angulata]|uniref:ATP-dependent DNA helicase n=1 Tax=Ephemerocybe angulata TaxID=980116 RepID=A0A8H6M3E6_9AGAR|nr:hypothetical protein DFP72DRAFT_849477 [Tulosesus angulatus]